MNRLLVGFVKSVLFTLVLFTCLRSGASSQATIDHALPYVSCLAVSPLMLGLYGNFRFLHAVSERVVLGVGVGIPWRYGLGSRKAVEGLLGRLEFRWYPNQEGLLDLNAMGMLTYGRIRHLDTSVSPLIVSLGGGWDWYPGDSRHLMISLGLGAEVLIGYREVFAYLGESYNQRVYSTAGSLIPPRQGTGGTVLMPWAKVDFGWAW